MSFLRVPFIILFFCILMSNCIADQTSTTGIEIVLSPEYHVNENVSVILKISDTDYTLLPNLSSDVNITMKHYDTSIYLMQEAHPYETTNEGIYAYNFTANLTGIYTIYVTYGDIFSTELFVMKINLSRNITEQRKYTENITYQEHIEREDALKQIIYNLKTLQLGYQNITRTKQETTFFGELQIVAQTVAYQILFYIIIFVFLLMFLSLIYTRRKERRKAAHEIIHIPETLSGIMQESLQEQTGEEIEKLKRKTK